jgi:hypothetical protein
MAGEIAQPELLPFLLMQPQPASVGGRTHRPAREVRLDCLFRWFVGPGINDPVRVPAMFTRNRGRLLTTGMSGKAVAAVLAHREVAPLVPDGRFPANIVV